MKNRWSEREAASFVKTCGRRCAKELALRTYSSRLLGAEKSLVLHGGGNTSVKGHRRDIFGKKAPALFVKASGYDLASITPEGHCALELDRLLELGGLKKLSDSDMAAFLRKQLFDAGSADPSIEALLHAFIPKKYIDHTHSDAILALTNRKGGEEAVREALGDDVIIVPYVIPGFDLAKTASSAYQKSPQSTGIVLMKHGLITWGDTARESYESTVGLVTKAEKYLARKIKHKNRPATASAVREARKRYIDVAPVLRGLLAVLTGDEDRPFENFILKPIINQEVLALLDSKGAKETLTGPPLTSDHIIRTKPFPLFVGQPHYGDEKRLKAQLEKAVASYAKKYERYYERYSKKTGNRLERFDPMPRVILMPGLGAVCAGRDAREASIARDITAHTLDVKAKISASGEYEGLAEKHLFDMEYFGLQHAKLDSGGLPLRRRAALVTGAAGAIGYGICAELLANGCHVAATDLPGKRLDSLAGEFGEKFPGRIIGVPLDVTDAKSVAEGFGGAISEWGGIDLVVINAGVAHVSPLAEMDTDVFRKLEEVNVEGTLHLLAQSARHFKRQGRGGDVVVVSTKNVFAPGAKFGAYSATKAASHQLARIASLELAESDVRVNMVAPDAVFSAGARKSGLWAEVGPDRMRARGLDEKGLEEYYRNRNLLKAKITAKHVAKAVLFFATRQTPTTGATLPVDGGLPDATPR